MASQHIYDTLEYPADMASRSPSPLPLPVPMPNTSSQRVLEKTKTKTKKVAKKLEKEKHLASKKAAKKGKEKAKKKKAKQTKDRTSINGSEQDQPSDDSGLEASSNSNPDANSHSDSDSNSGSDSNSEPPSSDQEPARKTRTRKAVDATNRDLSKLTHHTPMSAKLLKYSKKRIEANIFLANAFPSVNQSTLSGTTAWKETVRANKDIYRKGK
jgi:hypothetical protein